MKNREYYIANYGLGKKEEYASEEAFEETKNHLISLHPDQRRVNCSAEIVLESEIEYRQGEGEDIFAFDPLYSSFYGIVFSENPTYRPIKQR